jgi:hypothetical protein
MDEVRYERVNDVNILYLKKKIPRYQEGIQ